MLLRKAMIMSSLLLIFSVATSFSTRGAQEWKRYVPAAERKAILSKATRSTGLSAKFVSKVNARVLWVTDEVARTLVSDMLDRKQITEREADYEYFQLRPEKHFLFILFITAGKSNPWGPLDKKGFSLYKENDPASRISEGEVSEAYFNEKMAGGLDIEFDIKKGKQYYAMVPRRNPHGEPVIRDLNDEPQAMFSLQDKEVYLKFVVKDLVTNVKDL